MTKKKSKIKAVFHFTYGATHEAILTAQAGTCYDMMVSVTDQLAKYNTIAFLDPQSTDNQFILIRENIRFISFYPIEEKDCEENEDKS